MTKTEKLLRALEVITTANDRVVTVHMVKQWAQKAIDEHNGKAEPK
jgi:hypothetical protein